MSEWKQHSIYQRDDGSYIITNNGNPYHVPDEGEFVELYAEISVWLAEQGITPETEPEPPAPPEPTPEELAVQAEMEAQAKRAAEAQEFLMGVMEVYNEQ